MCELFGFCISALQSKIKILSEIMLVGSHNSFFNKYFMECTDGDLVNTLCTIWKFKFGIDMERENINSESKTRI